MFTLPNSPQKLAVVIGTWTVPAQDEVDRYPFLQEMVIQVTPNGDMVIRERPAPEEFPDPIDDNAVDEFIAGGDP